MGQPSALQALPAAEGQVHGVRGVLGSATNLPTSRALRAGEKPQPTWPLTPWVLPSSGLPTNPSSAAGGERTVKVYCGNKSH